MRKTVRNRRLGRVATLAIAAVGLIAVALPLQSAKADGMYFGWDFGNGVGLGVGTPPSAWGYHYCGLMYSARRCY